MKPNESAEIKVTFNSTNKVGKVTKTVRIYSNDESEPIKKIMIYAKVIEKKNNSADGMHSGIVMEGNYFKGKCIGCHVAQGVEKYGKALFDADCAMCHGQEGKGVEPITTPLKKAGFVTNISNSVLYNIIANGSSDVRMQGFAKENGGPLNRKQVESLVGYIRILNEDK